jgi:hypothetical protein
MVLDAPWRQSRARAAGRYRLRVEISGTKSPVCRMAVRVESKGNGILLHQLEVDQPLAR